MKKIPKAHYNLDPSKLRNICNKYMEYIYNHTDEDKNYKELIFEETMKMMFGNTILEEIKKYDNVKQI